MEMPLKKGTYPHTRTYSTICCLIWLLQLLSVPPLGEGVGERLVIRVEREPPPLQHEAEVPDPLHTGCMGIHLF